MRKLIILIIFAFGSTVTFSQQELNTQLLRGVWQANRTNPALLPDHWLTIGLPGFYDNAVITNVTYNDLLVENENGETILDANQAISQLDPNNLIRENLDVETISVGLNFGKFFLSFGHTLRFNAFLNYPKTLPQLVWQGNSQFIGQTVDFGFDLDLFSHHEYAIGAAIKPLDNLTLGARVKYLSGVANISTSRNSLSLYTDPEIYELTLNTDFQVNSAGSLAYDGFDDLTIGFDFGRFDTDALFAGNSGYAFDFGAHIDLGKIDFAISALDVGGQLNWKDDVTNWSLDGSYEYKGLDIAEGIFEDSTEFGSIIDTLQELYSPVETQVTFSTKLPARYYFSTTYQFSDRWRFGGIFYAESYRDEQYMAFGVGANYQLLPILNVGASYAYRNEFYDNIGLNATVKVGPVQVVAATDNILTAFRPADSNSANVRLGINLLLGKKEDETWKNTENQDFFFNN